jgi:hypothetical protein
MIWILAFLAAIGVITAVTVGPRVAKRLSDGGRASDWRQLEADISVNGTEEQLRKLAELKRREIDIRLRMIEMGQAQEVLSSPKVRQQLEEADVDVEQLKQLLDPETYEDELDRRIRLLEEGTKGTTKLLKGGKRK